eukprot:jgi/Botrbrau1/15662/Bobra.4_1s0046.1
MRARYFPYSPPPESCSGVTSTGVLKYTSTSTNLTASRDSRYSPPPESCSDVTCTRGSKRRTGILHPVQPELDEQLQSRF